MAATLDPSAAALADAVRALERTLDDTRAQWNDVGRRAFDQRHALVILGDAKQTVAELQQLSGELTAAVRLLAGSG
jgi:predicted amino acid-binding ACT domain protein